VGQLNFGARNFSRTELGRTGVIYIEKMKSLIFATFVALSLFSFVGCANQASTTTTTTTSDADPGRRTYSNQDLNKTGRTQTGEAVQALDPSVGLSGSGR
jgi:hypothetical protein